MKKVTKTTKNIKTPALVVDFTNPSNIENSRFAFIEAKMDQNVSFTENDLDVIIYYLKDAVIKSLFSDCNAIVYNNGIISKCTAIEVKAEKKLPWYKRLWNKITGKK